MKRIQRPRLSRVGRGLRGMAHKGRKPRNLLRIFADGFKSKRQSEVILYTCHHSIHIHRVDWCANWDNGPLHCDRQIIGKKKSAESDTWTLVGLHSMFQKERQTEKSFFTGSHTLDYSQGKSKKCGEKFRSMNFHDRYSVLFSFLF
jgi:hypothetical protein